MNRIHFLDNLRTAIICLVVVFHSGGVYESAGTWAFFWIVDDPTTSNVPGLVGLVLDIVLMPTMFLVSGFLVLTSLENRGSWAFLRNRFRRLMLPWLVSVLTLIPLYKMIFLHSRGLPQEHWSTYFCWSNSVFGQDWILGHIWLWFLPMLFLFDLLYLLLSKTRIDCNLSLRGAIAVTFLIGFVCSVSLDLLGLRGWTKTTLLNFQNERIVIYFLMFLLGAHCFKLGVFDRRPKSAALYIVVHSVYWIPLTAYIIFLLVPFFKPGAYLVSPVGDRLIVWFSFHLSLFCLMYVLIETFRRYFNKTGRFWNDLNRNSYYVYIIHTIVLGVIAMGMLRVELPGFVKYVVLAVATIGVSNLAISLWRKTVYLCRARKRIRSAVSEAVHCQCSVRF